MQIVELFLVVVGLFFERYAAVGKIAISTFLNQTQQPFRHVKNVERDIEQLTHLAGMDAFMVEQDGVQARIWLYE